MSEKRITTMMTSKFQSPDHLLDGSERYPVIGNALDEGIIVRVQESLRGLSRYWSCLEKAIRARVVIDTGEVVAGSLLVRSEDDQSEYGYYFNPPLEFHCWIILRRSDPPIIFDPSLPGVIEMGLTVSDELGPCLVGRKPSILAGPPEKWMHYKEEVFVLDEILKKP